MPNRIIRESILTSRAVNSLSDSEEIFYRRLMSIVDDWGRHEADPDILLPKLYPLQLDRHTTVTCGQLLSRVSGVRTTDGQALVKVYEVDGRKYLEISNFNQRTRAKESRCPSPDGHTAVTCQADDGHTTANVRLDVVVVGDGDGDVIKEPPLVPPAGNNTERPRFEDPFMEDLYELFCREYAKVAAVPHDLWRKFPMYVTGDAEKLHANIEDWVRHFEESGRFPPNAVKFLREKGWVNKPPGWTSPDDPLPKLSREMSDIQRETERRRKAATSG